MAIRYKVVNSDRTSCLVNCTAYSLTYKKGTTVEAKANTLGIMVFKRLKDAKNFALSNKQIIRVRPIGRAVVPIVVSALSSDIETALDKFYTNRNFDFVTAPPDGTLCYKAVEVLE